MGEEGVAPFPPFLVERRIKITEFAPETGSAARH